jgi:hypothetical protein
MRTMLIIVLGLFIARNADAQVDSLIIKLDDAGYLIIISPNLVKQKQESFDLNRDFSRFYADFIMSDKSDYKEKPYIIKYEFDKYSDEHKNRSLTFIERKTTHDIFYFQDGKELKILSGKYKLELASRQKVVILIDSLKDLEKISRLDLDTLYLQSLKHFQSHQPNKRLPYNVFYSITNNSIDQDSYVLKSGENKDFINLGPTFGMWFMNSSIFPELTLNADFIVNSKNVTRHKFGISTSFLFMPDKNDFYNISTYKFVNVYYHKKYRDIWDHTFSIGYMYDKNGNDFSNNTWNAYWQTNINKIGFRFGGFYTKNLQGKNVIIPSIGLDFGF